MKNVKPIVLVAFAFLCSASTPPISVADDPRVPMAILKKTKLSAATYAIYTWTTIKRIGMPPIDEWSAEFNDGPLHRVETPRDRVIANCLEKSGSYYSIVTDKVVSGPQVAEAACGINTSKPIISMRYMGRFQDSFGPVDRVEVTDAENIRTYDVTEEGILIRTTYALNTSERPIVLEVEPVAVNRTLPNRVLFEPTSLKTSQVPDEFKHKPATLR